MDLSARREEQLGNKLADREALVEQATIRESELTKLLASRSANLLELESRLAATADELVAVTQKQLNSTMQVLKLESTVDGLKSKAAASPVTAAMCNERIEQLQMQLAQTTAELDQTWGKQWARQAEAAHRTCTSCAASAKRSYASTAAQLSHRFERICFIVQFHILAEWKHLLSLLSRIAHQLCSACEGLSQAMRTHLTALRLVPEAVRTHVAALRQLPEAIRAHAVALRLLPEAVRTHATTLRLPNDNPVAGNTTLTMA